MNFEQLISFHPTFDKLGDQPTIRDMIFDHYCRKFKSTEKANTATKRHLDEVHEVFQNQFCKYQLNHMGILKDD